MALLVSDPDVFEQIVHHIFLPPQLPQERSHACIDAAIFRVTSAALAEFEMSLQTQDSMRPAVSRARTTLMAAIDCHGSTDGGISEFVLRDRMERLEVGGTIILQIRAQNAGLIFTRQPQCVRFEVFELAPQNQEVIAAKGRLIRQFPGFALDVPSTTYDDAYFRATLAQTLATMSGQSAPGVQPQILKAGRFVDEERDTTHPAMVTEFLMGFLMAHGRAVDSIITVTKNTRDDVLFKESEMPWRRSPAYLLIRVSLHLLFTRHLKGSDTLYKAFMAFFMAKLLQNAQRLGISTDLQYAMSAKVARRLQKQTNSGKGMPDHVRKLLHDVQDDCSTAISRAWVDLQYHEYNPCRTLSSLAQLQFSNDSVIDLPLLDDWLAARPFRQSTNLSSPNQMSSELHLHAQLRFPSLQQKLSEEYRIANLHSFEDWCAQSLRASVTAHDIDTVCHQVYSLIVRYHQHATSQYEAASGAPPRPNNPEESSSMILIILELWQAMDKQAVENCSLLAEYDPQIPVALFQNLLLPTRDQMVRLERLEVYLHTRQTRARERLSSDLFGDAKDNDCFAVRYFEQDDAMQALFEDITARGREGREAKIKELYANYERYEKLENEIAGMECSFFTVEIEATSRIGVQSLRRHDDRRCEKCAKIHDRDAMRISVHEWPLPSRQEQAKAVVFELCIPRWYADWRDCTAYLLQDVLQLNNKGADRPKNQYALDKDPHVGQNYHSEGQRIILWTKNKTHVKTHRRTRYVSTAVEKDVCVDNATFYQYLDTESKQFGGRYESHKKAEVACTYLLPQHTRELQPFLFRPADAPDGPSPNMIIASQSLCPSDGMTVDEFKEMCSIPGGTAVQWYNIALQLASPTVDLKKEETVLVFLQCIYQAGPNQDEGSAGTNGVSRASHAVLNHTDLARTLLECLEASLEKIKRNWESMHALVVFTAIASRLLTMNAEVQLDCLSFLQKVRETAFFWLQDVHERAQAAEDHVVRTQFLSKGIDIALICGMTFDVDRTHLTGVLAEDDNVWILLRCAMAIAERAKAKQSLLGILAARFKRVLYRSHPIIRGAISHTGLDRAVKNVWSGYPVEGSVWRALEVNYWLQTTIFARCSTEPATVQFNLLTGELLVDGLQHKTPPLVYERHSTYKALFGDSSVEVMPSKIKPASFATKGTYGGYSVHIGITKKDPLIRRDLVVIAMEEATRTGDARVFEIVPSRLLRECLPERFVTGHVHWYDTQSGSLQFRSITAPWDAMSPSNWTLVRSDVDTGWHLQRGETYLLGSRCQTSVQIAQALSPLVHSSRIEIVLQADQKSLEIEIPTARLGFTLQSGQDTLRSKEYRGMIVDRKQSAGTLIGLSNKLLLRPLKKANRLILIPDGDVSYKRCANHVNVNIEQQEADGVVDIHSFEIDMRLGRPVDNGSLQSKLFIAFLHAVTSFALPDPLTKRTGTEQALSVLRSAAMRSFEELSAPNIDMLMKIAALSPARFYYPPDAKVMQSVRWDDQLSFMAQHGDFYSAVGAILRQAAALRIFYPGSNICIPSLTHIEKDLHHRDMIRTAVFRVAEYGAEHFTTVEDVKYQSRDRGQGSPSATKACVMSRLIVSNSDKLHWRLPEKGHLWKQVMDLKTLYGAARPLQVDRMAFDARLMQGNSNEVAPSLLSLHRTLGSPETDVNRPALMMWLSTMALSPDADMALLQVVAMFLTAQSLRAVVPPAAKSFCPAEGQDITLEELQSNIADAAVSYKHSPDAKTQFLRAPYGNRLETNAEHRARCEPKYNRQVLSISKDLARGFHRQWVSDRAKDVSLPEAATKSPVDDYIDCAKMMEGVNGMLEMRRNNQALQRYLDDLQVAVSSLSSQPISVPNMAISHGLRAPSIPGHATVEHVFADFVPQALRDDRFPRLATQTYTSKTGATSEDACPNLRAVVNVLEEETANQELFKKTYVEGLRGSMNALQLKRRIDDIVQPTLAELNEHLSRCEEFLKLIFANLVTASRTQLEKQSGGREDLHWPRPSPSLFLAQLNRDRWQALPSQWKKPIVQYGIAITAVQRAERLLNAEASKNLDDMQRELSEVGHTNWDPLAQPETLLLEVEGAIMVRDVQEDIAREMRSPSSRGNQVVQLNMGEGKSSVIVPMVAAALGNGKQLVRVIVAKPQSKQMAQMLVSKLGGLVNRRIYFMPYSRALRLTRSSAEAIDELCRECMKMGGILLLQPEHILSFKLTGPESVLAGNKDAGASFLRTQELFDKFSRDIVDESDENFNVKFELVYTLGIRRQVDFAPARWGFVQHFLALVKVHAQALAEQDAKTMEFNTRGEGGFPRIRILQEEVARELVYRIAKDVTEFGLLGLPTSSQSDTVRASLFKYITTPDLTPEQTAAVETSAFWTANTKQALLLTRGLLAGGILQFVFCLKRWRVTYGLTTRSPATRLAVPYRAKDSPSPRSEFSHPDVVILLTSLSYYYGGLPDEDLFTALGHLMTCDQADAEYRTWLWDVDVPVEYRHLAGINIKDRVHCITKVFPHLRYSKGAIDYWLSHVVFPREMKEYPHKLSASGCDLGRLKTLPTTCFSGTNDSRALLPLDVRQIDIPEQMHTNALVLEYLLRFENTVALMPSTADASATDAEQLLDMVMNLRPVPQVILDVGAFVLELDNKSVAASWLAKYHANDKSAAVFCNDQDELSVIDRTGRIELLQTSSYKERMDMCIVYLDEAHTRGIDLKLPVHWRAACTLGANLSKDRLVQACMRMRKLGKGQTIVFCVPNEIKESILRDRADDETNVEITTASVVRWVILQTWTEIKHSMALWVAQNHRFNIQKELWDKNTVDGHYQLNETSAREFREEEARTLDFRYRPKPSKKAPLEILAKDTKHRSRAIIDRCELYGMLSFNARKLTEEQERELSPECDVDAERVVQKPPAAQAAQNHLHRDILSFVMTGEAKQRSSAYGPAFHTLSNTSPALHFDVTQFRDQRMLVSTDFSRTILDSGKGALHDSYQRSVQWVLTGLGKSDSTAEYIIIISPYEAQHLVARGALLHSRAALHLYRPRYNIRYRPMEKLDFYQISSPALTVHVPLSLSVQLGVFAGQLYWNSYAEYVATTHFLGLLSKPAEQGQEVTMDGFIRNNEVGLCSSPVNFLKVFLSKIRRGGDDISKSHMGMLLDGKVFRSEDFV